MFIAVLLWQGYFGMGMLSTRGLEYDVFSKKMTETQLKRKLMWREITLKNHPKLQIPKKYVYIVPDEGSDADDLLTVDPFPVAEPLVLMPEEAVYLAFALGCLVVTDETGKALNIDVS